VTFFTEHRTASEKKHFSRTTVTRHSFSKDQTYRRSLSCCSRTWSIRGRKDCRFWVRRQRTNENKNVRRYRTKLRRAEWREGIFEAFVEFEKEVSVVCAGGQDGSFAHYGVIENAHSNHILDVSFAPGNVSASVKTEAIEIARSIVETLGYVGTLCVEFFLTKDDKLLVNELAPRPHNSGHLTFDACVTSQFEQQLRAVCRLPLGSTEFYRPPQ
jgi:phosphoribosylaminoimidazole carboxylase (NCAIR synthetase)